MRKILFITVLYVGFTNLITAQEKVWTMNDCMRFAVENSPKVKKQQFTNDTYKAEYQSSVASFFPSLEVSTSAQYSYGRSIDPETNTYDNTSTFNNGYSAYTSIPLFNGGQLVNQWRLAKVNKRLGMNNIQKEKDDLALNTMQAFMNVVYYQGTVKMASEKLVESNRILYKTQRMEELGLKGRADVAQIEAQAAADDYNLTHQENLYTNALLTLKEYMNYPFDQELEIDTTLIDKAYLEMESIWEIYEYAKETNPTALEVDYKLKAYKMEHLIYKGKLFPTISFSAGVSTNYYENLKSDVAATSFGSQFKNNRGEYFSFNLSFPLFSRLSRLTNIRRARNNVRIAEQQQTEVLHQLQVAIEKAVSDRTGYAKESIQMEKKRNADEIAYQATLRKFEEGLMSPIDLQTSANTLLLSKADLLQKKLMYILKCKEVDYYKGVPLINEQLTVDN